MKEDKVNQIKHILDQGRKYKYNSLTYINEEDLIEAQIYKETEKCILAYKYSEEKIQLYWASKNKDNFIEELKLFLNYMQGKKVYIEFIPEDFIIEMEEIGFDIVSEFVDFWIVDLHMKQPEKKMPNVKIREISETEYYKASYITQICRNQSRGFNGETEDFIKEWNESKNSQIFVAERDDEILGICLVDLYGFESEKGTVLWIRELAVNPIHQRRGIGRALLNYAINWGKINDAKRSFLACDVKNDNAIQLYESIGYKRDNQRGQINMENDKN